MKKHYLYNTVCDVRWGLC